MSNVVKFPAPSERDALETLESILRDFVLPDDSGLVATKQQRRNRYAKMTSTMRTTRARAAIHVVI
jgi:hypothetical protein